jgi:hypothetical protein
MENFAAGIVPYIIIDGHIYFLLGLELSNNKWSGFIGKSQDDETVIQTALREFNEETVNLFEEYSETIISELNKTLPKIDTSSTGKNVYIYFLQFPEQSQELIKNFINAKAKLTEDHYLEKGILKWFNLNDIKKSNRILYRLKQMILTHFL